MSLIANYELLKKESSYLFICCWHLFAFGFIDSSKPNGANESYWSWVEPTFFVTIRGEYKNMKQLLIVSWSSFFSPELLQVVDRVSKNSAWCRSLDKNW